MKSSCSFVVLFFFAAWYGQWYPLRQVQEASAAGPLTVKLPVNQPQSVYVEGETLLFQWFSQPRLIAWGTGCNLLVDAPIWTT